MLYAELYAEFLYSVKQAAKKKSIPMQDDHFSWENASVSLYPDFCGCNNGIAGRLGSEMDLLFNSTFSCFYDGNSIEKAAQLETSV